MKDPRYKNKIFSKKNTKQYIQEYTDSFRGALNSINEDILNETINKIVDASEKNNTIFSAGNGGSASISDHLICDLVKGTYVEGLPSCKGFSLTANQPLYSAIANDFGLGEVFSKQIKFLGSSGDILIAISSSGNSENIINGVVTAKEMGIHTIGFSGFSGGKLSQLADTSIHINVNNYGVVEDAHMSLMHIICQIIANKKDIIFDCQNK